MEIEKDFFEKLKQGCYCVKIRNSYNYCEAFMDGTATNNNIEELRKAIEPWLSGILQSEHLALLIGTGLTQSVCGVAQAMSSSMGTADFKDYNDKINKYAEKAAQKMGRGSYNIEDQIRTSLELLSGYEIDDNQVEVEKLSPIIDDVLECFGNSILQAEKAFNDKLEAEDKNAIWALKCLVSFMLTFSSRNATRDRLHVFTTNYDRFIEYACDNAGIKMLDRFFGKIQPVFSENEPNIDYYYRVKDAQNEFRYAEGVIRYSKLHGSVDWVQKKNKIFKSCLKFGADKIMEIDKEKYKEQLMIYPNSMKSVETAFHPYAELFRDFSGAICRPNSVLVTYGYGFGDSHINKVIKEMLSIPSTHMVIIAYAADERLIAFLQEINLDQITLICGKEIASIDKLASFYLPKSAIDKISLTVSKLLKDREGYREDSKDNKDVDDEVKTHEE